MREYDFYKVCPVCGAGVEIIKTRRKFYCRCSECGDKVRTGYYLKEKEAVKAWNRGMLK